MFQSARINGQIYILHKTNEPYIELGTIIAQPLTKPKYMIPQTFGQPQELVTDLSVKVNDVTVNYNGLPAQQDIADTFSNGESIVVADSKEAMNSEILSLKQKSVDTISSVDFHNKLIASYDKILSDLNPEYAERKGQEEELKLLKSQVGEISKNLAELMRSNSLLIERLSRQGEQL